MTSIYDAPAPPGDEERRWAEVERRLRAQTEHGPVVRGPSNQLCLLILTVLVGGFGLVARVSEPLSWSVFWQAATLIAAVVVSAFSYVRAKRGGRLLPQLPIAREERALSPLFVEERRELGRQLRGRGTSTERSRAILRQLVVNGRLNNRAAWPSVAGMLLFLFSLTLFLGWPWPLLVVVLAVFLCVASVLEARRWRRITA